MKFKKIFVCGVLIWGGCILPIQSSFFAGIGGGLKYIDFNGPSLNPLLNQGRYVAIANRISQHKVGVFGQSERRPSPLVYLTGGKRFLLSQRWFIDAQLTLDFPSVCYEGHIMNSASYFNGEVGVTANSFLRFNVKNVFNYGIRSNIGKTLVSTNHNLYGILGINFANFKTHVIETSTTTRHTIPFINTGVGYEIPITEKGKIRFEACIGFYLKRALSINGIRNTAIANDENAPSIPLTDTTTFVRIQNISTFTIGYVHSF